MNDESQNRLHAMRHSLAHIMASAIQHLWPQAKFGVGPVVEHGFYYDVDLGEQSISDSDFARIEAEMQAIIKQDQPFERQEKSIADAIAWAEIAGQPYKLELLRDLQRAGTTVAKDLDPNEMGTIADQTAGDGPCQSAVENVSYYVNGDFTDLCRGPHVESTGKVGAFKLMRVAGAYWRGKDTNPQMQRIYGVAFETRDQLREHLAMLEEAKKRDHRKLGQELDLFVISDLVGPGLPLFTPRGTILHDKLGEFSQAIQAKYGYERVKIPHMTRSELYKVSGHYDKYPERFMVHSDESDDEFMLKPMSCPHHVQIFASRPRSYRDLPIRYMENTQVYRDEKSGELHGLSRVRMITQDDSHAFIRPDQVEQELGNVIAMVQEMYSVLGMDYWARLSFRDDSDKYMGDIETWQRAQEALQAAVNRHEIEFKVAEGEAAFYGPKVDFMVRDAIGREWQCATMQLDFLMPERFQLEYTDSEGNKQRPAMVHKAILGSIERFLSVYIEHTAGKFPVWLAPEQIRLASVNQEPATVEFVERVVTQARERGLRVGIDNDNESVGKKIRAAETWKVPYTLVIGQKEVETGQVSPRIRGDLDSGAEHQPGSVEAFLDAVATEAAQRVNKTTL